MKTFYVHIDLGDLVYSLYFAKRLGVENYLIDSKRGICKFNEESKNFITPLIKDQEYIKSVEDFNYQPYDFDYGSHPKGRIVEVGTNLTEYHASKFDIDWITVNEPWLKSETIDLGKKIIINRTPRYQKNYYFYNDFLRHINLNDCIFIGLESEWKEFCYLFRKPIDFYQCSSSIELASVINGCETFLGNQSLALSIATGLGKHCFVEIGEKCANYIFNSKKIVYF